MSVSVPSVKASTSTIALSVSISNRTSHTYPPPGLFEIPVEHPNHGRFTSPYHWREQYKHGNTAPAEALLEQYRHTKCVSVALRAQLEGKTYRQAAIDNGYSPASFPKYMKRAARLLRDAYAA
jgi:hypothetical protein